MRPRLLLIAGTLLGPFCVAGLLFRWPLIWVLCPQAILVMFVRQWQNAYDSLGAADWPDLAVAASYGPMVGYVLHQADKRGKLARVSKPAAVWHLVAIFLAYVSAELRNKMWGL
jgi:hypothetical protein